LKKEKVEETVFLKPTGNKRKREDEEDLERNQWLQGIRADCIPIAGRTDIAIVLVTRGDTILHTDVVPTLEDMDPIGLDLPNLRPMPYGRYRTSAGASQHIGAEVLEDSKDTLGN